MSPAEKLLFTASRNPRGVPFIPLGRLDGNLSHLEEECRIGRVLWLEVHREDGVVQQASLGDLTRLHGTQSSPAHLIGFTAPHLVEFAETLRGAPGPNLFHLLEADRTVADPTHQRRFLSPTHLKRQLTQGDRLSIAPIDYAHRCSEIIALSEQAGPNAPGHLRTFLAAAERYARHRITGMPEMKVHLASDDLARLSEHEFLRRPINPPTVDVGSVGTDAVDRDGDQLSLL